MRYSILVTLDQRYILQLLVLMTSLHINDPGIGVDIYLLHSSIAEPILDVLRKHLEKIDCSLYPIKLDEEAFKKAPVTDRYPKEMYYRLLAAKWLPEDLEKVLYLDPDILVINPVAKLWNMDISDYLFAAASHTGKTEITNTVNKVRLGTNTKYYNSGVLMINLKEARKTIKEKDVFAYVEKNKHELLLPDQDVMNALYADRILEIDDSLWNYDARNYRNYLLRSSGEKDIPWVIENTSILHFCGREKPWNSGYRRKFGILYRHYMKLAEQYLKG